MSAIADFENKVQTAAVNIAQKHAREFVANLQPGDKFAGLNAEAGRLFTPGSVGYGLFINYGLIELARIALDLDKDGTIISMAKKPDESREGILDRLDYGLDGATKIIMQLHNDKVALLAACKAVDGDVERLGTITHSSAEKVREAIAQVEG